MKKEDFKDIFNPEFMETVKMIIELNEHGIFCPLKEHRCNSCPFSIDNTGGFCISLGYSSILNRAKAFKAMVEEEKEKLNFKEINNLTKEIIENTDKKLNGGNMQEFKVGDRVKTNSKSDKIFHENGKIIAIVGKNYLVEIGKERLIMFGEHLEKIDDKPQEKHFELKKGMKIVRKDDEKIYFYTQTVNGIIHATDEVQYAIYHFDKNWIDWEATKKLNEVKEESKEKPFELKEGMKFKSLDNKNLGKEFRNRVFTVNRISNTLTVTFYYPKEIEYGAFYSDEIDWEATRKLNEVNEEPKKDPKPKEYMIFNPKGNAPIKIHNSLESAEKEVIRLLNIQSNQEFYILEIVKKAKGSITVSWSE